MKGSDCKTCPHCGGDLPEGGPGDAGGGFDLAEGEGEGEEDPALASEVLDELDGELEKGLAGRMGKPEVTIAIGGDDEDVERA